MSFQQKLFNLKLKPIEVLYHSIKESFSIDYSANWLMQEKKAHTIQAKYYVRNCNQVNFMKCWFAEHFDGSIRAETSSINFVSLELFSTNHFNMI